MAQKSRIKSTYTIYDDNTTGVVEIADEVITAIAAIAATETEGVDSIAGGITHEKAARAGARALSKGVRTEIEDGKIRIRLILIVKYDYSIPDTTARVQERVKNALETMTGFTVSEVSVSVADVRIDQSAEQV